jgi:hypothetical protein
MTLKYVRLQTFGLKSKGGSGSWEPAYIFSGKSYKKAFYKAMTYAIRQGHAAELKIEYCDEDGDELT